MEGRVASTWRMSVNEKKFIESALDSDLRIDGRNSHEFRKLTIKFGREDGSSEVQLGQTHVMGFVTSQLVQPYRDRPNEGSLSIFSEFSPMADPSFEPGRPGESAVELGRIIDRGLRESRAVDTESLCVLAGKLVWAIRIDLHILDNGGNLVDAANIAALAALLTFRRPECTLGGEDGQQVIVHPPEVKEPLPLIVHHLPIAVTFAFFSSEHTMVVDPTHNEEAVMTGRMTVTVNANGDICSIQKAGGEGVMQSRIMHCLRVASRNAESITKKIKDAVEAYNTERALRKIKRHSTSVAVNVSTAIDVRELENKPFIQKGISEISRHQMERLKLTSEESSVSQSNGIDSGLRSSEQGGTSNREGNATNFLGGPSRWDPYSKGVDSDFLKASLASHGVSAPNKEKGGEQKSTQAVDEKAPETAKPATSVGETFETGIQTSGEKTLKDAVKPKNKRRKRASSSMNAS
ncbi:exosome complex component RRP45A [Ricinus communis]|uniref:Protein ECERIFERUM 7 n=1 Tax=Ricinus communis TaxID=3988 RepID=B9SYQ9_RICCO|nr:exosome complex component RRP45A [Ricinus communis]EEF31262.1 exosome complex exonuclease rrp45, putative [Ricinus communis]|eukprot:XP_002531128.1 exosome complex component RRP45A [Ricinus communis]